MKLTLTRCDMGDAADALTESGIEEWALHVSGRCDTETPCSYCQDEQRFDARNGQEKTKKKKNG